MDDEENVTITYETLFEILRREKDRLELQKLDNKFYSNVVGYLIDKQKLADQETQDQLSDKKATKQLENLKKILKELYDRREKKIMTMALDKTKTNSDLIDGTVLLEEEKGLFGSLVNDLKSCREDVLLRILKSELPAKDEPVIEEKSKKEPEKTTRLIRLKHSIPKFVGLEGEEFGPFEEEDMASLPTKIAEVLINKGRAEEIKEE
ncbi:MAG: hypothetical protein ABIC04_04365 [Nanoarchaeota archaeon]